MAHSQTKKAKLAKNEFKSAEEESEEEDYFSCNSGIGAIKFRKRLQQLQQQSKKLENLQFQLLTIKNADYVHEVGLVCTAMIVQPSKANKPVSSKQRSRNKDMKHYQVVFELSAESETERAFSTMEICKDFWTAVCHSNNEALVQQCRFIETVYTAFVKKLNNKYMVFLMAGEHDYETHLKRYRLVDLLQSLIVELCKSLQITSDFNANANEADTRKLSLIALIEVMEEVFGGTGDDVYPLNETEFVCCMRVRIGMDAIWSDDCNERLERLFNDVYEHSIALNTKETQSINFEDFKTYFSSFKNTDDDDDDDGEAVAYNGRLMQQWQDIRYAVSVSPLSKRNQMLREKENISAVKYKEKLSDIEKLIHLLEETVVFPEKESAALVDSEQLFWRKKIMQHRQFVRYYQEVIFHEILNENNQMKAKIDKLSKLNKFSRKVAFEEHAWFEKNQHLLHVEEQYNELLRVQKLQQQTMKKCEWEIQQKEKEIQQLKAQLIRCKALVPRQQDSRHGNDGHANEDRLNNKLLRLKGEIAHKKMQVQSQLNIMTANINMEKDQMATHKKRGRV